MEGSRSGASWQSGLDDRSKKHTVSYGLRGIVQAAKPDCTWTWTGQSVLL